MKGKTLLAMLLVVLCATLVMGCSEAEARYTLGLQSSDSPMGAPSPADEELAGPGDEEAVIDSGGEVYTAPGASGKEGVIPGGPQPAKPEERPVSQWELYRNDTYGYEIRYPPNYVILPDYIVLEVAGNQEPQPLHRVWFQDKELAEGETAAMEPPKFSIEIFDNKANRPIKGWLGEEGLLEGFQVEAYTLAGVEGVRVRSMFLMAPNEHIYLPQGNCIYKLTPLGRLAEKMLATFNFTSVIEPLGE